MTLGRVMEQRWLLAAVLVVGGVFVWSVMARLPHIERLSPRQHQWLTASTKTFADNWLTEGAATHAFALMDNPPSIELPTLMARGLYVAYPPGAVLLPWATAALLGLRELPLGVIRFWGLVTHGVVVGVVLLLVWGLGFRLSPRVRSLHASAAGVFAVLEIDLLYQFGMVYFADQAVLLYTSLVIGVEYLRVRRGEGRLPASLDVVQHAALLLGVLTDWYALVLGGFVLVHRVVLLRRSAALRGDRVRLIAPVLAAIVLPLLLFGTQLAVNGGVDMLVGKFLSRSVATDVNPRYATFADMFAVLVRSRLRLLYLVVLGIVLVYGVVAWRRVRVPDGDGDGQVRAVLVWCLLLVLLPVFVHLGLLFNHSVVHHFSMMKQRIVIAVLGFGMLPLLIHVVGSAAPMRHRWIGRLVLLFVYACMVREVVVHLDVSAARFVGAPMEHEVLARHLRVHAEWRDVYCSSTVRITAKPPWQLALSGKMVHQLHDVDSVLVLRNAARRNGHGVEPRVFWVRRVGESSPPMLTGRLGVVVWRGGGYVVQRVD